MTCEVAAFKNQALQFAHIPTRYLLDLLIYYYIE